MKGFFSRLHDTQTGHSKSAAPRDSYKFWIPNVDPNRESAKLISTHENVVKPSVSRPHGEKRISSRPVKSSQPIHMPPNEPPFASTSATVSGQTTEYIRPNLDSSSNQYYPQPTSKVTSTRIHDYDDSKRQPPPRPPSRPSYPTRLPIPNDNIVKNVRYPDMRNEPAASTHHQVWIPTVAPSTSRQVEEPKKLPQEGNEALGRLRSRYDENDRPLEIGRRERDRLKDREREKPRERDSERDRPRYGGKDREQANGRDDRERERPRPRERDRERERERERQQEVLREAEKEQERIKERELEKEREREREREREKEREREREREREKEREREREREKEREREREREKERELGRVERERERERERLERERLEREERDRLERDRERERDRQRDRERAARHAERERREREREKEKARIREREWEQKVKERESEAPRESPTSKGKERAREERTVTWDQSERPSGDGTRTDVRTQDKDFRKDRESRTTRDYRSRDRDRDQLKYRAEATDGEQDLRRSKPRIPDRDKRKDANQGWVSDYVSHERRPSRTVLNPEPALIEEGESSDGSLKPKQGIRSMQRRARIEDGITSAKVVPRTRQGPPDFRHSLLPPNHPHSVPHPIVSEVQPPVTSTPLNMPVYLPPREARGATERSSQQISYANVMSDVPDVPFRREISRVKLNEPQPLLTEPVLKSTENPLSSAHRRPPSNVPGALQIPVAPQVSSSQPSRSDYPPPPTRQQSTSVTQTNSNLYSEPVKETISRSDWANDQRLHPERPFEHVPPTSQPRMEPSFGTSVTFSAAEHLHSGQQEKIIMDLPRMQTPLIPSEGYSRSRLNSFSNKVEALPSSNQNTTPSSYPVPPTQDKSIAEGGPKQTPRSRLNSFSFRNEPFLDSHRNISVYHATIEQQSSASFRYDIAESKEGQKEEMPQKTKPENTSASLPPDLSVGPKQLIPLEQEEGLESILLQHRHAQSSHTIDEIRSTSRAQYFTQSVSVQPVQVSEKPSYSGASIQRPPTASGHKEGPWKNVHSILPSTSLGADTTTTAQASSNVQSQMKPIDSQSRSDALYSQRVREIQDSVDETPFVHPLQNRSGSHRPAPHLIDNNLRTQEQNVQDKVDVSNPGTGSRQDSGRTLRHPGASISTSSMYPETIHVLPSLQPSETLIADPPQTSSVNALSRIESFTQATVNTALNPLRLTTSERHTQSTDSHEQNRIGILPGTSTDFVSRQEHAREHAKVLQSHALDNPNAYYQGRQAPGSNLHPEISPEIYSSLNNQSLESNLKSQFQYADDQVTSNNTVVDRDTVKTIQNKDSPTVNEGPTQEIRQVLSSGHTEVYHQSGFVTLREDESPSRKQSRHNGVTFQTPKTFKDDINNPLIKNVIIDQLSSTTRIPPLGHPQRSEPTDTRTVDYISEPPGVVSTPGRNTKEESPTVRSRNVASTPKVEISSQQLPNSWNMKQDSPRGIQPTFSTPAFGHQLLPPVIHENVPQLPQPRQRRDSKQDSPRTRTENRPPGSPGKNTALLLNQTSVTDQTIKIESSSVENKEIFSTQTSVYGISERALPKITEADTPNSDSVHQLRIPPTPTFYSSKPLDEEMNRGGFIPQPAISRAALAKPTKLTDGGVVNGSDVPQLRIPRDTSSSTAIKFEHGTPRAPPLSVNIEPSIQAPPLSAKTTVFKAIDRFANQSDNPRPQSPHANLNHEPFPAHRGPVSPSNHLRTASGSKQGPVEVAVDNETPSLGFFSSTFSSALNAPANKGDERPLKAMENYDRANSNTRSGRPPVTTRQLDTQHPTHGVQGISIPNADQKEITLSQRPPDVEKKANQIEQIAPSHTAFVHPVLAEILSSPPPTKTHPAGRIQSSVLPEDVVDSERRTAPFSSGNLEVSKTYNTALERPQAIPETIRSSLPRKPVAFQVMPTEGPASSKEHIVQENRPHVSRASNVPSAYQITQAGREPSYIGQVVPPSRLPSSSFPGTSFYQQSDGPPKEMSQHPSHENRPPTARASSGILYGNQGGREYSHSGSALPATGAPPSLLKQESASVVNANPVRSSISRSGLDPNHTTGQSSYDKRGYVLQSSVSSQQPGENRGPPLENHSLQRIITPATPDFRPPPVPHASQVSQPSSSHPSNRHRYSASLPVSFTPAPIPAPPLDTHKREDSIPTHTRPSTQRTTSHYQTTFTPFQTNTFPVNVPTTDASIVSLPHAPSEETILMTPSSLARSMMLKPTTSRQSVTPSVASQTGKKGGLLGMFRRVTTPNPAPAPPPQYEIWHPNVASNTPESSPGHPKITHAPQEPQAEAPSPKKVHSAVEFSIPVPIHGQSERKVSHSHVFTPFKYLTTKRNRAVSVASVEAQDGTAPNTVVGSPTASMHSQVPILPPPVRDPWQATHEWRNKEEADAKARAKAKLRRQPPGVVFDVGEEAPDEGQKRPRRMRTKYRSSTSTRQATGEPAPQARLHDHLTNTHE